MFQLTTNQRVASKAPGSIYIQTDYHPYNYGISMFLESIELRQWDDGVQQSRDLKSILNQENTGNSGKFLGNSRKF